MKAIIIEDEELGRDLIRNYLNSHHEIDLVGEFADGFSGLKAINDLVPDIVFLDVQMPKLTGLELLELLEEPPSIIFTTAYDEFAVKAFELNAIDYLLKPFSKERFDIAVQKAIKNIGKEKESLIPLKNQLIKDKVLDKIVVKSNNNIHVIALSDLNYIESEDDYVMIHTSKGKHLQYQTMQYYEDNLSASDFVRIHRSFIVNINQITKLEKFGKESYKVVLKNGEDLKVSRSRYQDLKSILGV